VCGLHPPLRVRAPGRYAVTEPTLAAALTGILASHTGELLLPADAKAAKWAFELADEMLKARRSSV
jgi:hypothetical protein